MTISLLSAVFWYLMMINNRQVSGGSGSSSESKSLSPAEFKRKLMELGFSVADFPDDDVLVLDKDNDGTISSDEFVNFVKEGMSFADTSDLPPPPVPPVDDLQFKAADLEGVVSVTVRGARELREPTTWFSGASAAEGPIGSSNKPPTPTAVTHPTSGTIAVSGGPGGAVSGVGAGAGHLPPPPPDTAVATGAPAPRPIFKYDPKAAIASRSRLPVAAAELIQALDDASTSLNGAKTKASGKPSSKPTQDNNSAGAGVGVLSPTKSSSTSLGSPLPQGLEAETVRSVSGSMTKAVKDALHKAGEDAGIKLHIDPTLQKTEISRTLSLGRLKLKKMAEQGTS